MDGSRLVGIATMNGVPGMVRNQWFFLPTFSVLLQDGPMDPFAARGRHCSQRSSLAGTSSESNSTRIIAAWLGTASARRASRNESSLAPLARISQAPEL